MGFMLLLFFYEVMPERLLHRKKTQSWSQRLWQVCRGLLLLSVLGLSNCTTLGQYLETREGQGCYRVEGHARAYVVIHGLLATGGATLEQCASYHNLGGTRIIQPPAPRETTTETVLPMPPDWWLW